MAVVKQYDRTPTVTLRKEKVVFSDFFKNFNVHPEKKDLARHVNEYAVSEALKNLLLTNRGERFFNNEYGCELNRMLFEQIDPFTISTINTTVRTAIENFEPRARVISINCRGVPDQPLETTKIGNPAKIPVPSITGREILSEEREATNTLLIEIVYSLVNSTKPITLNFILDRVR